MRTRVYTEFSEPGPLSSLKQEMSWLVKAMHGARGAPHILAEDSRKDGEELGRHVLRVGSLSVLQEGKQYIRGCAYRRLLAGGLMVHDVPKGAKCDNLNTVVLRTRV